MGYTDSVSQLRDSVCGSELDGPQEVDPSAQPFREILEAVEAFSPKLYRKRNQPRALPLSAAL